MIIRGYEITGRVLRIVVFAVIGLLVVAALTVPGCLQKRRTAATQERLDREIGTAKDESGKDAIATVTKRGAEETASEALTRDNERDIRSAPGADDRLNTGVDVAGRRALCRRSAYAHDPRCKVFRQ